MDELAYAKESLEIILRTMNVPVLRKNDFRWLSRNLTIGNREHPELNKALKLIKYIIKGES
jgi:hypothetical protein